MEADNINSAFHEFKPCCCRKGCNNEASCILTVIYLDKKGYFCGKCASELLQDGLISRKEV
jgi:hypothetical protein